METIELKTTSPIPPVVLQCVDGLEVRIVRARRVHHVEHDPDKWEYTKVIFVTADGDELMFDDASDIIHFKYVQDEVADKLFHILDDTGEMWPITASQLLKFVAAAAVEEAVEKPEAKEEVAEAA